MPTLDYQAHYDMLDQPQKMYADGKLIYVADYANNRVVVIDYECNYRGYIGSGFLTQPTGVNLIGTDVVAICAPRRIRRFDASGALVASRSISGSVQPQVPTYVPGTRETIITEFANNRLICLDENFNLIGILGSGVTGISNPGPADFYQPKDVIYVEDQQVGPSLYLADSMNQRVLRIRLDLPNAVGKMTLNTANTTEFTQGPIPSGGQPFRPVGITYDPQNELLFCVDGTGGEVWMVDIRAGSVSQIYNNFGTSPGQLFNASGITLVAGEFLAISDWTNNRVTVFRIV